MIPLLLVVIALRATTANLCVLCNALAETNPSDFHSCVYATKEIRECDQYVDKEVSLQKIIGVHKTVQQTEHKYFEIKVDIVNDSNGTIGINKSTALIRFRSYPSWLFLSNPCKQNTNLYFNINGIICNNCIEGGDCVVDDPHGPSLPLRKTVYWVSIGSAILTSLLIALVMYVRKSKPIQYSIPVLTLSVIAGSSCLYSSSTARVFGNPDWVLCVLEPWAREVGFVLVYSSITLKIYRTLVEFRTRKAHRWVVREKDIIRYLATTIAIILFYLLSSTANYQHCFHIASFHRINEFGELLYLSVGLNMAWHVRKHVSAFLERQMYTAALVVETASTLSLMLTRETKLLFFNTDDMEEFLVIAYFIRNQVTTTIVLALVLAPKLYYVYVDSSTRKRGRRSEASTGTLGASTSISNLAKLSGGIDNTNLIDLDFAEVSLAEMDPQDIKIELKRVYTQLELLRNKTMRKDNPHISKRRGGRKPTHRRFSLQKKGSRDKTAAAAAAMRNRMQADSNPHKLSCKYDDIEDSVCSIEGPSTYSEVAGYR